MQCASKEASQNDAKENEGDPELFVISAILTRSDVSSIFMNLKSVEKKFRRNISRNKMETPFVKE